MTTATHTFLHSPREGRWGGRVGIFLFNTFSHLGVLTPLKVSSFEYIQVSFKHQRQWIVYLVIYRPPWSNINLFFWEFSAFLDLIDMISFKIFIVDDFNIWMDDNENCNTVFCEFLESYQLSNSECCNFINGPYVRFTHM